MKRFLLAGALLLYWSCFALAQTGSVKTQSQLNTEIGTTGCVLPTCLYPDNSVGAITPFGLRQGLLDLNATMFGGLATTSGVYQVFTSPGSVTTLTLTTTPIAGNSGLLHIFFDGVEQAPNTYSYVAVSGIITFNVAIPANVLNVVAWWLATPAVQAAPLSGTWSPTLSAQTPGNLSITYGYTPIGNWIRIGPLVIVFCDLLTSSFTYTTATGQALIAGLPYNTAGPMDFVGKLHVQGIAKAGNTGGYTIVSTGGVSKVLVFEADVPFSSTVNITDFPSAGQVIVRFTLMYLTPDP